MANGGSTHIVWMDMEMTGLDVDTCRILEIACLITDANLSVISEELNIVIHEPDEVLENMNEWCLENHAKTGLIAASRASNTTLQEAEQKVLELLKRYIPKNSCPLAGNSIWMDRLFLLKYMPLVNEYLHYRIIDTSSIKELTRRWHPTIYKNMKQKQLVHRALDDIRESIEELKYYKEHIFRS